jgi:hypothetical protein
MTGTREHRTRQVKRLNMDRDNRGDVVKTSVKKFVHVILYNKNVMVLRKTAQIYSGCIYY